MAPAAKLDPAAANRIWLQLMAALPCPPGAAAGVGWPSPSWRKRYKGLCYRLVARPAPSLDEVAAEVWQLQCELRDASDQIKPPVHIAAQWEKSFARLGRAGEMIDHCRASQAGERGR